MVGSEERERDLILVVTLVVKVTPKCMEIYRLTLLNKYLQLYWSVPQRRLSVMFLRMTSLFLRALPMSIAPVSFVSYYIYIVISVSQNNRL